MAVVSAGERRGNFGASAPYTVGVEEELFVVERDGAAIACRTDELIGRSDGRFARGRVVGEMCDGVLELISPVRIDAPEAIADLSALRAAVGAPLMGVGVHPVQPFGGVRHRRAIHYDRVAADTRGLLRQSAYCGVHVHVGMPDPDSAIHAFNGMRKWIPMLQALSANSPFWHGEDSGLESCRTIVCHSVPRTGLPRAFRDWHDFVTALDDLCRAAEIDGLTSVWWDLRPSPDLGTLEVRALDAQSSHRDLTGLVALTHCLVVHESVVADPHHPAPELLQEASYRAIRDGLDATISLGGPHRPMRHIVREAIDLAAGYAPRLGCADALDEVERIRVEGNGATRQRRAYAAGGMPAVLELLLAETRG